MGRRKIVPSLGVVGAFGSYNEKNYQNMDLPMFVSPSKYNSGYRRHICAKTSHMLASIAISSATIIEKHHYYKN